MDRWNSDFAKHWLPDLDLQRAVVFHTSSMRQKTLNSGGLPGRFASSVRFNSINYGVTSSIHRQIDANKYTEAHQSASSVHCDVLSATISLPYLHESFKSFCRSVMDRGIFYHTVGVDRDFFENMSLKNVFSEA